MVMSGSDILPVRWYSFVMSNYQPHWDLTTVPEDVWNAEHGRRRRAKGPAATNEKLEPCKGCGKLLNATQRRRRCPGHGLESAK